MDYKFLAKIEIEKFFENTEFSVGEILLSILSHESVGVSINNRGKLLETTDQEWYAIIEKVLEESLEEDPEMSNDEFKENMSKIFKLSDEEFKETMNKIIKDGK